MGSLRLWEEHWGILSLELADESNLEKLGTQEISRVESLSISKTAWKFKTEQRVPLDDPRAGDACELRRARYAPHRAMIARPRGKPIHYLQNVKLMALALLHPDTPANELITWWNGWLLVIPVGMMAAGGALPALRHRSARPVTVCVLLPFSGWRCLCAY